MPVELSSIKTAEAPTAADRVHRVGLRRRWLRPHVVATALIAGCLLALALDNGGASIQARSVVGMTAWFAVAFLTAVLGLPRERLPRHAVVALAGFACFAAFTAASTLWAPSAERAFTEFTRVSMYLGVFAVVLVTASRIRLSTWIAGLALGIAVIAGLALGQRFFPGVFPETDIPGLLPTAAERLSWPIGYWNGLGIMLGIGVPLLLHTAVTAERALARGAAAGALPLTCAAIYLTSSRGGVATAAVGVGVMLAISVARVRLICTLAIAGAAAAGAILVLNARPLLVNGPLTEARVEELGPSAALLIAALCLVAAAAHAAVSGRVPHQIAAPRWVPAAAATAVIVAAAAAVIAVDPVERLRAFKEVPGTRIIERGEYVQGHLLSGGGSGRWQFWSAAADQFTAHPLLGQGAGSFEAWWARNGDLPYFARNAHSLWLETMGELGVVGLLLLLTPVLAAFAAPLPRLGRWPARERIAIGALTGALAGFAAGASIDWIWQLPVVAILGVVCMALLLATRWSGTRVAAARKSRFGPQAALLVVVWLLICAEAVPFLTQRELAISRSAAADGRSGDALEHATSASEIQPWAASPYTQLALVYELEGRDGTALRAIRRAIERDRADWRIWIIRARLATKAGSIGEARAALRQARALNPRSPLLR